MSENEIDAFARTMEVCPACGAPKDIGTVVCWDCFGHRQDTTPFKYFDGSLNEWLAELGRALVLPPEAIYTL